MTNKKAISILECMAIDITGALMDADMTSSKRTVLMQKLDAINLAQRALWDFSAPQLEKENNHENRNQDHKTATSPLHGS